MKEIPRKLKKKLKLKLTFTNKVRNNELKYFKKMFTKLCKQEYLFKTV